MTLLSESLELFGMDVAFDESNSESVTDSVLVQVSVGTSEIGSSPSEILRLLMRVSKRRC